MEIIVITDIGERKEAEQYTPLLENNKLNSGN
jgi:hypothetical protein